MKAAGNMPDDEKITSDCYIFLLAKAYQKGHHLVQKRLEPYGLTNIQYVVLEGLWNQEGQTAVELGKRLMIDKATLSGVLDRMIEAGWLQKNRDKHDRRRFRIFPSKKANDIKDELINERQQANEELLAGYTLEERILLRRLLLGIV